MIKTEKGKSNSFRTGQERSLLYNKDLTALSDEFLHIQGDYRKRRRAFDTLFKHCKYDQAGSFAYRWERALRRLDQTDADVLIEAIRKHIWVLNSAKA